MITASSPISQNCDVFVQDRPIKISGCILPGLNLQGGSKKCQDNYVYCFIQNNIFCALFDGHGPVGEEVANFCVNYVKKYFIDYIKEFEASPKEMLIKMLEECDAELRKTTIDSELSGSTAAVLLITPKAIHSISLGDSRAVLGTLAEHTFTVPAAKNKFCRTFKVSRILKPIPLTIDQKPNHEEEYLRIRQAGGLVEKIVDMMGNTLGPYRVWKVNSDLPGLAMSRSIGDNLAKSIGVISTGIYHYFTIYKDTDQYIVIASDGVWDVMESIEVINFIENFREKCENSGISDEYPATAYNSTIARMLCEEARYRWYGLVEAEDVNIDDISCIVIDISRQDTLVINQKPERNVKAFQSLAYEDIQSIEEKLDESFHATDEKFQANRISISTDKSKLSNRLTLPKSFSTEDL